MKRSRHIRVAFQGERGAFSEEAIHRLFPNGAGAAADPLPCPTFEELFAAVNEGRADYAVAPLENTLAGSVHRCYDLLLESDLHIIGEAIVPIAHCLIGCESASLKTIRTAESHPVALAQCQRFFAKHPKIRAVAAHDTAGSVRRVVEQADPMLAAIAGAAAARVYGGKIVAEHLEDHKENYTRFALLSREPLASAQRDADKMSLIIALMHRPGALYDAMGVFAKRGIDLTKIESRPVKGKPWQYRFYLDLAGSTAAKMQAAVEELKDSTETQKLRILGYYRSASSNHSEPHLKETGKR